MLLLGAGLWAGLARLGLAGAAPGDTDVAHGALLVSGFVGTLVGLERAVVTRRRWAELVPVLSAASGVGVVAGMPSPIPALLALAAALVFVAVAVRGAPVSPLAVRALMAASALAWAAGAVTWAVDPSPFRALAAWVVFVVLVIAAERLELSRALRAAAAGPRLATGAALLVLSGLLTLADEALGLRVLGLATLLAASWLVVSDRPATAVRGSARFTATGIALSYAWLAVGGLVLVTHPSPPAGPQYDAAVHGIFVGFVLGMIFAHGPMVAPAVVGGALVFRRAIALPLALLHLSLLARVVGDLIDMSTLRDAGVIGTAAAVALYAVVIAASVRPRRDPTRRAVSDAGLR